MKPQLKVEAPKVVDAVQSYKTAFDAIDNSCTLYPKCKAEQELLHILSVQFELAGSTILVSDIAGNSASVKSEKTGCVLCIKTEDVEAVIAKVVSAGVIIKGDDVCCGGHVGKDKAPYGYNWLICSLAKNVTDIPTLLGSGSFFAFYFENSIENRSMETAFCLASCRRHEGDVTGYRLPILVLRGHTGAVTAIAFSPRPCLCFPALIVI
ncbi:uncharacterized protein At5g48480-like [Durio zibethinus]|uniref:Uncharacterized protein At5g48480-like n=1 Tax=Durio zibethinus TaxID=66656 RepID=A0A6P6A5U8_DURZI|nr:uncharacterized protein At5g48480-like [Durio zibethinus]